MVGIMGVVCSDSGSECRLGVNGEAGRAYALQVGHRLPDSNIKFPAQDLPWNRPNRARHVRRSPREGEAGRV